MKLGSWLMLGWDGAVRESSLRIPGTWDGKRDSPSLECRVTLVYSWECYSLHNPRRYEITLADMEYNIRTNYGRDFATLVQAKFVADLKLTELGFIIENPFDAFWPWDKTVGE